jgi:hypothetical protein
VIKESIELLGLEAKDRVTGFNGVIASVTFDLYGCVQAIVTPPVDKDGKTREGNWFDIKRLETGRRVMAAPQFELMEKSQEPGPGERPRSMPHT